MPLKMTSAPAALLLVLFLTSCAERTPPPPAPLVLFPPESVFTPASNQNCRVIPGGYRQPRAGASNSPINLRWPGGHAEPMARIGRDITMSYQNCTFCGSRLHTRANCPHTFGGSTRRATLRCGYCGGDGHTSNACPHNASSARRRQLNDDFYLD